MKRTRENFVELYKTLVDGNYLDFIKEFKTLSSAETARYFLILKEEFSELEMKANIRYTSGL